MLFYSYFKTLVGKEVSACNGARGWTPAGAASQWCQLTPHLAWPMSQLRLEMRMPALLHSAVCFCCHMCNKTDLAKTPKQQPHVHWWRAHLAVAHRAPAAAPPPPPPHYHTHTPGDGGAEERPGHHRHPAQRGPVPQHQAEQHPGQRRSRCGPSRVPGGGMLPAGAAAWRLGRAPQDCCYCSGASRWHEQAPWWLCSRTRAVRPPRRFADWPLEILLGTSGACLNVRLHPTHPWGLPPPLQVVDERKYPHMLSVRACFVRGSVVRYVQVGRHVARGCCAGRSCPVPFLCHCRASTHCCAYPLDLLHLNTARPACSLGRPA